MTWLIQFFQTSIGKKFLMAVTGIMLVFFLITHLAGNLMLFGGAEMFNNYVLSLRSIKPLIRIAEVVLVLIFICHIFSGIQVTLENRKAKPQPYRVSPGSSTSKFYSRTMAVSGSVIFIFLVFHLQTFWWSFQKKQGNDTGFYEIVVNSSVGYKNPAIALFYIIALLLLAIHLRHGFQSAFQTFGLGASRYRGTIEKISILFWLIIPLGFVSIPLYFGFIK